MKAYNGSEFWARYRLLVLSGFGIGIGPDPVERLEWTCGHEVHIDDWRPAGKAVGVVILVHGAGGNGRILAPLASQLCDAGWRVLAPDLPGYGLTQVASERAWDYRLWPEIIAALAASSGQRVALVGASVGGASRCWRQGVPGTSPGSPSPPCSTCPTSRPSPGQPDGPGLHGRPSSGSVLSRAFSTASPFHLGGLHR